MAVSVMSERPPTMTARDVAVLEWVGEMYGADYGVLGVLLARRSPVVTNPSLSESGVRKQVRRWQEAGWVSVHDVLGRNWVTLTTLGYRRLGLGYCEWGVPATQLRHTHNVNVLRLWYEGQPQTHGIPWFPERRIRAERPGGKSAHVCDGEIRDTRIPDDQPPEYIGIEVELTHKDPVRYSREVFGRLRGGVRHLWYYVPDAAFANRLERSLRAAREMRGSQVGFNVNLFPSVEGVTYQGEW